MNAKEDIGSAINRLLRERLEQFEVPAEVRNNLREDLLNLVGRPERHRTGATFMTPEASMDGDRYRRGERQMGSKPHVD